MIWGGGLLGGIGCRLLLGTVWWFYTMNDGLGIMGVMNRSLKW